MSNREDLKEFFEFLKSEDALELYLENLTISDKKSLQYCTNKASFIARYYNGLTCNKNYTYWMKIYKKWREIIGEL